jgi:hypothetical protein
MRWHHWFLVFLFILLAVLATPTVLKLGAPLVCREPLVDGGAIFLKNKSEKATDKLVVFVHGVTSSSETAWTNQQAHTNWPQLMHDDAEFADYDIYVANYPSPVICPAPTIPVIANSILDDLKNRHLLDYSQIFVIAHSMGGIVSEQMMTDVFNVPDTFSHFREVIFFGSPTQGAALASFASLFSSNPQFDEMALLNPYLTELGERWEHVLTHRLPKAPFPRSYCGYENYAIDSQIVVPTYSGQFHCDDDERMPVLRNHVDMVKPEGYSAPVYLFSKRLIISKTDTSKPAPVVPNHGTKELKDCRVDSAECGFEFSKADFAPDLSADILVMNQTDPKSSPDNAMLFASSDGPPVVGASNSGGNAGVVEVPGTKLEDVASAPEEGYVTHWVPVKVGTLYCVRTRDGQHYAKIKIVTLDKQSIRFDWQYQPDQTRQF